MQASEDGTTTYVAAISTPTSVIKLRGLPFSGADQQSKNKCCDCLRSVLPCAATQQDVVQFFDDPISGCLPPSMDKLVACESIKEWFSFWTCVQGAHASRS